MSLYTKLFGENKDAVALLGMLSLTRNSFGRYRDVYLNKAGDIITVLTRIGGGNAKEFAYVYNTLKEHSHYIRDYEDDFDETYAYFEFNVPTKYKQACRMMAPAEDRLSVGDMFHEEIEEASNPNSEAAKRMDKIAKEIMNAIDSGNTFISL